MTSADCEHAPSAATTGSSGSPVGKRDLLCFCGQDWWYHNRAHSDFQLMLRAAKDRRVLLVNSIGMRMPTRGRSSLPIKKVARKLKSMLRHFRRPVPELPNFAVLSPVLIPAYGRPRLREWNARLIRAQVRRGMRRCGIVDPHVMITVPTAWDVAKGMSRATLTYNRSDKHSAFPEANKELIESFEQKLMAASDLVLYSSRAFLQSEAEMHSGKGRFLDHGVDLARFAPTADDEVDPIPDVPRPVIGFFGALRDHVVDMGLLVEVARAYPNASLVLVGPTNVDLPDALTRLPNVHYLGPQPHDRIPAFGRQFDVALMPWLDNDWIRNCNPIKFKEYLALGCNVVSTGFPELDFYEGLVHVAQGREDFVRKVGDALAGGRPPALDQVPERFAGATWDDRAQELLGLLDGVPRDLDA